MSEQIFKELEIHATIEDEMFYLSLRGQQDLQGGVRLEQVDIDGTELFGPSDLGEEEEETGEEIGENVIESAQQDD